jgi:N-acetylglucosamine-6-sulfatase
LAAASVLSLTGFTTYRRRSRKLNILFILTDDQRKSTLAYMPTVRKRIIGAGMRFANGYAICPLCGPARTSMVFTGKCVHNHGISSNQQAYERIIAAGFESNALGPRVQAAGYRTAYFGKYMNGYEDRPQRIPPGWNRWFSWFPSGTGGGDFKINDDGDVQFYDGDQQNDDRLIGFRSANWIRNRQGDTMPWFAVVGFHGPHGPWFPSPLHAHDFDNVQLPKPPSYNEADVSDKPAQIRSQVWTAAEAADARREWEGALESLQDVDDGIAQIINALQETGQLDDTLILYTADNGFMYGEHRVGHKNWQYEESIGLPFLAKGPGVPRGVTRHDLVSQLDIPFTICRVAGADVSGFDGRNLWPLFSTDEVPWRKRLLIEQPERGWQMMRQGRFAYIEHDTGEKELYDFDDDPYQLENTADIPSPQMDVFPGKLRAMKAASGGELRAAEVA